MTICPQEPILVDTSKAGMKALADDHLTFLDIGLGLSLMVLIRKGFETDGASVPEEDLKDSKIVKKICKFIAKHYPGKDYKQVLDYLIGDPFEMPRLLAAIVHDALYGMKWKWRWLCDRVYRAILLSAKYDEVRLGIEYSGIRLVGKKNWNAVSDLERDRTRRIVSVKFVLTKNIWKVAERIEAELNKKS